MRIMVVGSGGREHALAWKLAGEPAGHDVICAPGNAGIGLSARLVSADVSNPTELAGIAVRGMPFSIQLRNSESGC